MLLCYCGVNSENVCSVPFHILVMKDWNISYLPQVEFHPPQLLQWCAHVDHEIRYKSEHVWFVITDLKNTGCFFIAKFIKLYNLWIACLVNGKLNIHVFIWQEFNCWLWSSSLTCLRSWLRIWTSLVTSYCCCVIVIAS